MESIDNFNDLRQHYKPEKVNVLFIADAPAAGSRFFYRKNSELFKAVKAAFTQVFGEFADKDEFLDFYKAFGCYLDNICLVPVKHLSPKEQNEERRRGIPYLAERIAEMQPRLIIITMKAIEKYALEAISQSKAESIEKIASIPFPLGSMTNFNNSISGMVSAMRSVEW
ncbi:hypothetical protein GCM10027037_27730 [Mucilaginibacter koreensis]